MCAGGTLLADSSLMLCMCVQDVTKRMSLPMDIRLPPEFLKKLQMESPPPCKPLSRMSRRASLVSEHVSPHKQPVYKIKKQQL